MDETAILALITNLSDMMLTDENQEIELKRIISLDYDKRDEELKYHMKYFRGHKDADNLMAMCMNILKAYGINVIKNFIIDKNNIAKPFGCHAHIYFRELMSAIISKTGHGNQYKTAVYKLCYTNISSYLEEVTHKLSNKLDYIFIDEFSNTWQTHMLITKWFGLIFDSVDDYSIKDEATLKSAKDNNQFIHDKTIISMSLFLFYKVIFGNIKQKVCDCVLHFIDKERDGLYIDNAKLKNCTQMVEIMGMAANSRDIKELSKIETKHHNLSIYVKYIENQFIKSTEQFYEIKKHEWITDMFKYYEEIDKSIKCEVMRVNNYMNATTKPKIIKAMLNVLMLKPEETVKQSITMLIDFDDTSLKNEDDSYTDAHKAHMKHLYACLSYLKEMDADTVGLINYFNSTFEKHLNRWILMVQDARVNFAEIDKDGNPKKLNVTTANFNYIDNCLHFYRRIDNLIITSFQNDVIAKQLLTKATLALINTPVCDTMPSEMLSLYFDKTMKKSNATNTPEVMEMIVGDVLNLFKHVADKDIFINNYRDLLSKRLLNNTSTSIEDERNVIGKLSLIQGTAYTAKVSTMVNDFILNDDQIKKFQDETNREYESKFSVQVLSCNWVLPPQEPLFIPDKMQILINAYEKWYFAFKQSSKLAWNFKVGEITVECTFARNKYDFIVPPIHAIVLNVFNSVKTADEQISFESIMDKTNIADAETLRRILFSFIYPPPPLKKIILKNNEEKDKPGDVKQILETDTFKINPNFTDKMRRIKMQVISLDFADNQKKKNNKEVEDSRSFVIQACIVRIMKARKTLSHNELFSTIVPQITTFNPDPKQIKKNIEALIEREYLKRDDDAPNTYVYLA